MSINMTRNALALSFALCIGGAGCSDDSGSGNGSPGDASADRGATLNPDTGTPSPDKGTSGVDGAVPDAAPPADAASPTVLTSTHGGWRSKQCSDCHAFPLEGHTATQVAECAECHGGNGSCEPPQSHDQNKDCTSSGCHAAKHAFTAAADCRSCHYASQGVEPCS